MSVLPRRIDFSDGYHVRLKAALNGGEGRLMTLSQGGAYVATPLNLLPQAQLSVTIEVPELKRTVDVEAVVAWENRGPTRPSSTQPDGYGLRFIKVPTLAGETIRWLLQRERAGVFDDPNATQALAPHLVREAIAREAAIFETQGIPPLEPGESRDVPEGPPFELHERVLQQQIPPAAAGVYVLSYDRTMDSRVGRADADLRDALTAFIGEYGYFHFEVVEARKDRFERECELYHRMGGDRGQLDNEEHPLPPPGPQLKCPVCVKQPVL